MPLPTFDSRTEDCLATLLPEVQPYFRALIARANALLNPQGVTVKAISGTRSYEKQNQLYAQGRTAPGPIVTNARGGYSNHNFSIAIDLGLFKGTDYLEDSPHYDEIAPIGRALGLEWGGDWQGSLVDTPHWQIHTGKAMYQLRADVIAGRSVLHDVTLPPIPVEAKPDVTYTVTLDNKPMPSAWQNPTDSRAYVPVRAFLAAALGVPGSSLQLGSLNGALTWQGMAVVPAVASLMRGNDLWCSVRDLATWKHWTVEVDGSTIALRSAAGEARG